MFTATGFSYQEGIFNNYLLKDQTVNGDYDISVSIKGGIESKTTSEAEERFSLFAGQYTCLQDW